MDDSIYKPDQAQMIVNLSAAVNPHDQPVSYGPVLYDVLAEVGDRVGGVQYLLGTSSFSRRLFAITHEGPPFRAFPNS